MRPGVLLNVPLTVVLVAAVMMGKFCKRLGPGSGSWGSLGVTPSLARSMPRPVLAKMLLPRMLFPTAVSDRPDPTTMPLPLKAITLPVPGVVPPTVFPDAPDSDEHAVVDVGDGGGASGVGADPVAGHEVAAGAPASDLHAVIIRCRR